MKKLTMLLAAGLALSASALEITVGPPMPCDPSGYPVETNDLVKAVVMLQVRLCRLEAYAASNMLERAAAERAERDAREAREAERAKAEERRRVNLEFNRWVSEQRSLYGRMTLIDYDTNTCERVYRRMDGVVVRKKCYDGSEERKARAPRGRAKKGGAK